MSTPPGPRSAPTTPPGDALAALPVNGLGSVVYSSRALCPERSPQMEAIRRAAVARNHRLGVTGFLHREEDLFFQALEGPPEALREIIGLLQGDPRHDGLRILAITPLAERRFAGWAMGFSDHRDLSLFEWLSHGATAGGARARSSNAQDILDFLLLASRISG